MSLAALAYCFDLRLPANEKWLLVSLADYADEWGESVFPSLDTLEELADAWNYSVVFMRVEQPYNESERRPVIKALLAAFDAVHAQAAARAIESPGHPEAGDRVRAAVNAERQNALATLAQEAARSARAQMPRRMTVTPEIPELDITVRLACDRVVSPRPRGSTGARRARCSP